MSIIQGSSISASSTESGSAGFYDFPIENSLRFDGSSYLSRTPTTAGNRQTWTWSGWVKRGTFDRLYFFQQKQANGATSTYPDHKLGFREDKLRYIYQDSSSYLFDTDAVFRDTSAWYHIVLVHDTTQATAADRAKIYVNGVRQSVTYGATFPFEHSGGVNSADVHSIGRGFQTTSPANYFDGYLANIQLIDGQALDASYFGETKQDIWIPKTFDGTSSTGGSTVSADYGTNGFLLDFSSISGTTINDTAPIDTNHSSANNWTATGF